jgi:hypothetical protein
MHLLIPSSSGAPDPQVVISIDVKMVSLIRAVLS